MQTHVRRLTTFFATLILLSVPVLCMGGEMTITAQSGALQKFEGWGIHPTSTKYKDAFRDTLNKLVVKDLNLNMVRFYVGGTDPDSIMRDFNGAFNYPSGGNTIDDFKKQNPDMMFLLGQQEQIHKVEKIEPFCAKWAAAVKRLREEKGFDIRWCTITNEPNAPGVAWKGQDSTYRVIPEALYTQVVKAMRAAFDAQGLTMVKLYIPETSSVDDVCFAYIDSVRTDPDALSAVGGLFVKSYNMCADWTMKEIVEDMGVPFFAAAGANMIDWWQHQNIGATPENVGVEQKPDDDNWAAEMAGRILGDFNHGVTHWLTYLPAGEVDRNRRFAAHNLMQYFNSLDTLLQRQFDPNDFQVLGNNQAYLMITLKYFYLKQLTQVFDVGCRFRCCLSAPELPYDDMAMRFGQKPAVGASVAQNPDNSWTIAAVNMTGCLSDNLPITATHPARYYVYYPAESYDVTLFIEELDGTGEQKLALTRSSKTKRIEFEDSVTMTDGLVTVAVGPRELVSLRGAKDASASTAVSHAARRTDAVAVSYARGRDALSLKVFRAGTYGFELIGLDGRKVLDCDGVRLSEPCSITLGLGPVCRGAYLLRVTLDGAESGVHRIAAY